MPKRKTEELHKFFNDELEVMRTTAEKELQTFLKLIRADESTTKALRSIVGMWQYIGRLESMKEEFLHMAGMKT